MSHIIQKIPFISQLEKYPTGCESVSAVMALAYRGVQVTVEEFIDDYLPKGPAPQPDQSDETSSRTVAGQDETSTPAVPVLVGPDPWEVFPGDPYTSHGWGCFAPALKKAIEKCLEKKGSGLKPIDIYHTSIETLCRDYIDRDIPVIFWATIGMVPAHESLVWRTVKTESSDPSALDQAPRSTSRIIHWMSPMHCTLLIGYETASTDADTGAEGAPATITHYIFNDPTSGERAVFPAKTVEEAYHAQGEQALVLI
ncbi:MAG: C39 family peptidase [Firmicutes bacterium]|nr:C39 family peptidase [Bacillota bacterium]